MFKQDIFQGWQAETPDTWLNYGYPFEIVRYDMKFPVRFYGEARHVLQKFIISLPYREFGLVERLLLLLLMIFQFLVLELEIPLIFDCGLLILQLNLT